VRKKHKSPECSRFFQDVVTVILAVVAGLPTQKAKKHFFAKMIRFSCTCTATTSTERHSIFESILRVNDSIPSSD
jgi:hypothetical protein